MKRELWAVLKHITGEKSVFLTTRELLDRDFFALLNNFDRFDGRGLISCYQGWNYVEANVR